jgi:hypothetical protein
MLMHLSTHVQERFKLECILHCSKVRRVSRNSLKLGFSPHEISLSSFGKILSTKIRDRVSHEPLQRHRTNFHSQQVRTDKGYWKIFIRALILPTNTHGLLLIIYLWFI